MDVIKVNTNEDSYYDYFYNVYLWSGCGYWLQPFDVYANSIDEALCLIVAYCERNDYNSYLIDVDSVYNDLKSGFYDSEDQIDEFLLYIDATIEGATKPYYIFAENLHVNEIKIKGA